MKNSTEARAEIRLEVDSIAAFDGIEESDKAAVIAWIDSGAELFRLRKPDVPPKHLIVFFVVTDGEHILLVDHINSGLWLPPGGHVDPGEHPRTAVTREAMEELRLEAVFVQECPVFLSVTPTVGKTTGHTDVDLWYVLKGDRGQPLEFDGREFRQVKWFHRNNVPLAQTDPQMGRFLAKYFGDPA